MKDLYLRSERIKRRNRNILILIALSLGILILLSVFGKDFFEQRTLTSLGYKSSTIRYIDEYGIREHLLETEFYSKELEKHLVNHEFEIENLYLYYISSTINDDIVQLYSKLSEKNYSDENISLLFNQLEFREIIPLLVFDFQTDLSIYINDIINNRPHDNSIKLDNTYFSPYTNPIESEVMEDVTPLVNKKYYLPQSHTLENPKSISAVNRLYLLKLEEDAAVAFDQLSSDIRQEGLRIAASKAYQNYGAQNLLYHNMLEQYDQTTLDMMIARPGFSTLETGYSVEVVSLTNRDLPFENTQEYTWLINNCASYGFILRYPLGYESITGFNHNPAYFTYVGSEVAKKMSELNLTYDEYYLLYVN